MLTAFKNGVIITLYYFRSVNNHLEGCFMKKIITLKSFIDENCLKDKDIYILTRHIVRFEKCTKGNAHAKIYFVNGGHVLVKESPAEIEKKLS